MIDWYIKIAKAVAVLIIPVVFFALSFYKVERKIVANGIIGSQKQDIITSPIKDTTVRKVFAKEGDFVRKGDIIVAAYDHTDLSEQLSVARIELNNIENDIKRKQEILRYGGTTRAELERLENNRQQTLVKIEHCESTLGLYSFRAPYDGQIVNIFVKEQENITIGKNMYQIIGKDVFVIDCYIPERQYILIKKDQKVYIKSNLYNYLKYSIFHGVVSYVSDYGTINEQTKEIFFKVTINVLDGEDYLRVNSSVQCEIVRDRVPIPYSIFAQD
ncbi:MAG: HlyD family efflux transporter periplasmic adaptor subunit [Spirochaetota bacterium]